MKKISDMNRPDTPFAGKPRYEILDGLRGVAALMVLLYHVIEGYFGGDPHHHLVNHGYLAVDFFFVLSGFVVGYAYDDRWGRISVWEFCKRRLIRMHPMVLFGSVLGAMLFYFGASPAFPMIAEVAWWKVLLTALLGATLLPTLVRWDIRGWADMHPLNGSMWSLFWEYVANILYALVLRRLSNLLLGLFVAAAALLTLDLTLNIDLFGLLADPSRGDSAYSVVGGWSVTPQQLYIGAVRLLYPFFCGLLLARLRWKITLSGGFWWCSLLIVALLAMPYLGGDSTPWGDGLYNAVSILFLFPLIVLLGAGSRIEGRRSAALCKLLGDLSYPLYVVNLPIVFVQMGWLSEHADAPLSTHLAVGASTFLIAVGVAYAALKLYDIPLREWLRRRYLVRK